MSAVLPKLDWEPTTARGDRHGSKIAIVVVHRWGVRYTTEKAEAVTYHGVINYFKNRQNEASAHVVYPGSAVPGEATQMVKWADYAWAQAAYNPVAVEIESADAIWLGKDSAGFKQLARMVAYLVHKHRLPPVWSHERGFCRHGDLGSAGGNHPACPTTEMDQWKAFTRLVQIEHKRGGFRRTWGR